MGIKPVQGAIQGVDRAKMTTLGTGTTKTQIHDAANIIVPAWAREIVAFVFDFETVAHANDAGDIVQAKVFVESEDVVLQPFQVVLTGQTGTFDASATHDNYTVTPEIFECHAPVKGGEEIAIYGQMFGATATGTYLGATIIYSSIHSGQRQIFSKVGTTTSTPTTSGETTGTAYNIYGADEIIQVIGSCAFTGGSSVENEPIIGYFRITSPDFLEPTPLEFCHTPCASGLGTIGMNTHGADIRFKVKVPTARTTTIQDYYNLENDVTDAGKFTTNVFFHKVGR